MQKICLSGREDVSVTKILAVDSDRETLSHLEACLKTVFLDAEVITFCNALSSFRYLEEHKGEIALIFFPLAIRPFDGLNMRNWSDRHPSHVQ